MGAGVKPTSRTFGIRSARLLTLAGLWLLTATGCGSTEERENNPRPPSPINISVKIDDQRVAVSPTRFGAGPVVLYVANHSTASHNLTIDGPQVRQSVGPINPQDTATLKVNVRPGEHNLSVDGGNVRAADFSVGPERASGQNELLQP
jgi:hypothetical protein